MQEWTRNERPKGIGSMGKKEKERWLHGVLRADFPTLGCEYPFPPFSAISWGLAALQ